MKTIGVFFGSRSPEHDVSIVTGQLIISGLKKLNYSVVPVYLDKQGKWYLGEEFGSLKHFTTNEPLKDKNADKYYLQLDTSGGKMIFKQSGLMPKQIVVDMAFPAFHGQNGEDGTFQGLCELLGVSYVGCDVTSSALTMDKALTKMIYLANNIPTTEFVWFYKTRYEESKNELLEETIKKLGFPMIVKPARLGSSIGISKVKTKKELEFALEVAFHYDDKAIVETCIVDLMDVTCALIGNDKPIASELQESVFDSDVFSYEDKYLNDGGAQLGNAKQNIFIPARLDEKTTKSIQDTAAKVYQLLGCSGTARVDFLYDKKRKRFYANEVNTLPGTLYHHLWQKSGVELPQLLQKLVTLAEERTNKRKDLTSTFSSDILKFANSAKLRLKG